MYSKFKNLTFEIIGLILFTLFFINVYFRNNYQNVVILIVFLSIASYLYYKFRDASFIDFNQSTMFKLNKIKEYNYNWVSNKTKQLKLNPDNPNDSKVIQELYSKNKLEYLYTNATLVHFIYSIIALESFNPPEFHLFVVNVNNILKLQYEINEYFIANGVYPINTSEILEQLLISKNETRNNLHNFIYSVPKQKIMYDYIGDILNRYNVIVSRIIFNVHSSYSKNNKQRGINNSTKFIDISSTKPHNYTDKLNFI